jgi:hypothetical protein
MRRKRQRGRRKKRRRSGCIKLKARSRASVERRRLLVGLVDKEQGACVSGGSKVYGRQGTAPGEAWMDGCGWRDEGSGGA